MSLIGVFGGPEYRVRYDNGDETSYVAALYEGRITGGAARPDGKEILEVGFFSPPRRATCRRRRGCR